MPGGELPGVLSTGGKSADSEAGHWRTAARMVRALSMDDRCKGVGTAAAGGLRAATDGESHRSSGLGRGVLGVGGMPHILTPPAPGLRGPAEPLLQRLARSELNLWVQARQSWTIRPHGNWVAGATTNSVCLLMRSKIYTPNQAMTNRKEPGDVLPIHARICCMSIHLRPAYPFQNYSKIENFVIMDIGAM